MSYVSQELSDLFNEESKWYRAEYEVDGDPDDIKTEDLNDCHYKSLRLVQDKFEKLKAENEFIKEENEKLKQDTDVLVKGMETLQNKYMNECSPKLIAERDTYKMKNDKLKAENEIYRNAAETYQDLLAGKDGIIDKNDKLKELNKTK